MEKITNTRKVGVALLLGFGALGLQSCSTESGQIEPPTLDQIREQGAYFELQKPDGTYMLCWSYGARGEGLYGESPSWFAVTCDWQGSVNPDSGLADDSDDDEDDENGDDTNTAVTRLFANRPVSLQEAKLFDYKLVQLVLFAGSAEQALREFKRVTAAKCLIVDGSGALRLNRDVPLVVAGVNDEQIPKGSKTLASPSPLVVQLAQSLQPLREFGLQRRVVVAQLECALGELRRVLVDHARAHIHRLREQRVDVQPRSLHLFGLRHALEL